MIPWRKTIVGLFLLEINRSDLSICEGFTIFMGIRGSICHEILILKRLGIMKTSTRGSQVSSFHDVVELCANQLRGIADWKLEEWEKLPHDRTQTR